MTTLGTGHGARTPSGMRVAPTSYSKLEKAADDLRPMLPTVGRDLRGSFKLDALKILEQTLPQAGYNYKYEPVSSLRDCAGFTIPEEKLVVIREDVYEGLFTDAVFSRSTVIHELTHIALKHAVTLHRGAVLGQHKFCEDSEWQAKAMTVALMMPLAACKASNSPADLARMCGTSIEAATYRINRLIKDGLMKSQKDFIDQLL
jgi:Winged helix-turn-helix DNA-binding